MRDNNSLIEYLLAAQNRTEHGNGALGEAWEKERPQTAHSPLDSNLDEKRTRAAGQVKRFIDEMPGGFLIYHADGDEEIIYANQALLRLFNCCTMAEFQAHTKNSFRGVVHPEDLEAVEKSIQEQIDQSQYDLDYVEYRIIQKGGQIRWVEDFGHFIQNSSAGPLFYVFVADATEKRERQKDEQVDKERLLESRIESYNQELERINHELAQRLELIEGLSIDYESIFYVDLDEDFIQPYRVSRRAECRFGKDLQVRRFTGFADDYVSIWVCPEDRRVFSQAVDPVYIRETLEDQKAFHTNYRIVKDGVAEYLQMVFVNVGKTEKVSQIMVGCRRVDEEVRREIERNLMLENALIQAKAANQARNTFLSNMSHDIRTPMNAIIGFTALAKSRWQDQERLQGYLNMIDNSSRQLLNLIDDILEISWLESGSIHIEEKMCSLLEVAQDIENIILPQTQEKGVELMVDLSKLGKGLVYVDQEKLTQVIIRIAFNAVKYTERGGRITITFRQQNAASQFAADQFIVEDTGIGISPDFIQHIFEPFERQQNSTMSGVFGTGLGLPIAKNIVEMMGGAIEVESALGKGSRFTVGLTLRLQEEAEKQEKAAGQPSSGPQKILVVEDNELNREIEVDLLEDAGFLVDTACDGSVAVEKIKASQPGEYSLVLMDLQMPVMDGHTAARNIRALEDPALAGVPIVALSANAFDEDRKMSAKSGMNAHMAKPIDVQRLLELVENVVGRAPEKENGKTGNVGGI